MGIDTRILLKLPISLSPLDVVPKEVAELLQGSSLSSAQRTHFEKTLSVGKRLRDGTWIFESQAHYTPSAAALRTALSEALDGEKLPALHSLTPKGLGVASTAGGPLREEFEQGVRDELAMRFGDNFANAHNDPRGVFAFPESVRVQGESYEEALASVATKGEWIRV